MKLSAIEERLEEDKKTRNAELNSVNRDTPFIREEGNLRYEAYIDGYADGFDGNGRRNDYNNPILKEDYDEGHYHGSSTRNYEIEYENFWLISQNYHHRNQDSFE